MRVLDRLFFSVAVLVAVAGAPLLAQAQQGNSQQMVDLYNQTQQLQREMMSLRGLVEEQAYQIRKLERQRLADYENLDRRLQALGRGKSSAGSVAAAGSPTSSTTPAAAGAIAVGAAGAGSGSAAHSESAPAGEREAYQQAFQLLKQQKLPQAEQAYLQFLKDYPDGKYSSNAYYWLGELYLTDDNLTSARDTFDTLITRYPAFRKTPDSTYQLATVHQQLGDDEKAEELLHALVKDYAELSPDTVHRANDYLDKNFR